MTIAPGLLAQFSYSGESDGVTADAPQTPPRAKTRKRTTRTASASKQGSAAAIGSASNAAAPSAANEDSADSTDNTDSKSSTNNTNTDARDETREDGATPAKKRARKNKKGATPSQSNVVLFPHLNEINDSLADNLICLFIGINPGVQTAITGHAYAHKSNWFWKLLHSSTCVDRLLPPHYDNHLPRLFSLGCTNLVPRPTANQTQISEQEKRDGVPVLVNKIVRHRPESVCFVGKDIWKTFHKVYFGAAMDEKAFEFGWQRAPATGAELKVKGIVGGKPNKTEGKGKVKSKENTVEGKLEEVDEDDGWSGARIFVSFSTSGLVSFSPEFKKLTWSKLGEFVNERRVARGESLPKEPFEVQDEQELDAMFGTHLTDAKLEADNKDSTVMLTEEDGVEPSES